MQHRATAASWHFTKIVGQSVPKSTVCKFQDVYHKTWNPSATESTPSITEFAPQKMGPLLLVGDFDAPIQEYVCTHVTTLGRVVNARVVLWLTTAHFLLTPHIYKV